MPGVHRVPLTFVGGHVVVLAAAFVAAAILDVTAADGGGYGVGGAGAGVRKCLWEDLGEGGGGLTMNWSCRMLSLSHRPD